MRLSEVLEAEWVPALGCTEPAAVALASIQAATQGAGTVRMVHLVCDPRTYKNCFAVGLPNAGGRTGLTWALAIGAHLVDPSLGLRCFEGVTEGVLSAAGALMERKGIQVEVDASRDGLWIDVLVVRESGSGRALVSGGHANLVRLEADGRVLLDRSGKTAGAEGTGFRDQVAALDLAAMGRLALEQEPGDRLRLREGAEMNLAMARHGLGLMDIRTLGETGEPSISRLVSAGVYARMSGESLPVMSLAGSGNKGITLAVPLLLHGRARGMAPERIDEALALGCLLTVATTHHLGTLSAVCGAANAGGIGIAGGLVLMEGGDTRQVGLAVSSMVGNLAGMVCDGAKIGCALKTMTGVDAAFRAASLALAGIGIPGTDGIVGETGESSLANLGRLARRGMAGVDADILGIMQDKLRSRMGGM
nr:L-serine ammonia-lyase, iron-sulfur-dependent, subunit alpha [uncultured Holophaga sp.]